MNAIRTLKEADKLAQQHGLVRGKGKYCGCVFWTRPGSNQIVTRERLAEICGRVDAVMSHGTP